MSDACYSSSCLSPLVFRVFSLIRHVSTSKEKSLVGPFNNLQELSEGSYGLFWVSDEK